MINIVLKIENVGIEVINFAMDGYVSYILDAMIHHSQNRDMLRLFI